MESNNINHHAHHQRVAIMKIFSAVELRDIAISMAVLCIVFSFPESLSDPFFLLRALLAVGVGFIGHELSHKFAAIRQGFWSEYRMWPQGLVMALLLAAATGGSFIFAAPGAVYFQPDAYRRPKKAQLVRIGMAGITFNIAVMWLALAASLAAGWLAVPAAAALFIYVAIVNGWLAIFNLIPFGGLDGQKLLALDRGKWALLLVAGFAGFIASSIA